MPKIKVGRFFGAPTYRNKQEVSFVSRLEIASSKTLFAFAKTEEIRDRKAVRRHIHVKFNKFET